MFQALEFIRQGNAGLAWPTKVLDGVPGDCPHRLRLPFLGPSAEKFEVRASYRHSSPNSFSGPKTGNSLYKALPASVS